MTSLQASPNRVMLYGMTFRRPWLLGGMFGAIVLVGGLALGCGTGVLSHWGTNRRVSFSRDIRPILNQNCVPCHGGVRQKNGVSFIFREEALGVGKSGRRTIVPGKPEESELIARVTSKMQKVACPTMGRRFRRNRSATPPWIKEGASWEDHWAFVAPKPQALPR